MKTVFIGGSRSISRLNPEVRRRLDQIMEQRLRVLVGDANGADKAVQVYLKEHGYDDVLVFCTAGRCRNNVADWQVRSVEPPHKTRDFEFFTAKDAAMARDADVALMLWDGKSPGTVVNIARMIAANKPAVVYLAPENGFRNLRTPSDFESFRSLCPAEVRARVDRHVAEYAAEYVQPAMFSL